MLSHLGLELVGELAGEDGDVRVVRMRGRSKGTWISDFTRPGGC